MWIWFVLVGGIFNVLLALMSKTENLVSSLLFKVVPFFLGVGTLIYFLIAKNLI